MVRRSDIENDVSVLLNDLRENDYEIPTLKKVIFPTLIFLKPLYLMTFFSSVFSFVYHGPHELWVIWALFVCDSVGLFFITFLAVIMMSENNLILLCLSDEVRRRSIICTKWYSMVAKARCYVTYLSLILSLPFVIFFNWGFTVPMWSGFVLVLLSGLIVGCSLSNYFTPEFIRLAKNIREFGNRPSDEKKPDI